MSSFQLKPNEEFDLRFGGQDILFRAMEHPASPKFVHAASGGKATVFRIRELSSRLDYALKVMKFRYQDSSLEAVCRTLDQLKGVPGLKVCDRRCLTPSNASESLTKYPGLLYSILMPWVEGPSWFDTIYSSTQRRNLLDKKRSFALACNLAEILLGLERLMIAHCDLSATNIIYDPATMDVHLIDVEDIFAPSFPQPNFIPSGTPGYQHKESKHGQWHGKADRFAGAILLSEMLGWYADSVRAVSYAESYFDPAELQTPACAKLDVLAEAISGHHVLFAELLNRAWNSTSFDECPAFEEWGEVFIQAKMGHSFRPIDRAKVRNKPAPFWGRFEQHSWPAPIPKEVTWSGPRVEAPRRQDRVQWKDDSSARAKQPRKEPPVRWKGSS
jgi:hypothetical protein